MSRTLTIPPEIRDAVDNGAVLAVSVSGGKDSQALLQSVCNWADAESLSNLIFAIHADLGRAEWAQTPAYVEAMCKQCGVELVVVRRERNGEPMDLVARIEERKQQLEGTGKPFWPSAMMRYCTADLKREPINKYLRRFPNVVSIEGIRAEESPARAKKPRVQIREEIATRTRQALTWYAILDWTIADVWASAGQSQQSYLKAQSEYRATGIIPDWWNFHPAYAMGNHRLSCAICVLADMNDVLNGIKHNPELANHYEQLEREGSTFRHNFSITDAKEKLQQTLSLF